MHTVAGLETMLYSFFIIGLSYYAYRIISSSNNSSYWLFGIFALLSGLLRFESIIITMSLILLILWFNHRKYGSIKLDRKFLMPVISLFFIPILLYMILRFQYFQDIIPAPYYAKALSGNLITTASLNLYYIFTYFLLHIITYLFVIFLVILGFKTFVKNPDIRNKYFNLLIIYIIVVVSGNIIYLFSNLSMNYADRLFYPSYILMYLVAGISVTSIFINKDVYDLNPFKRFKFTNTLLQIVVVFLILAANLNFIEDITALQEYETIENQTQIQVGMALQPFSQYNYTVATDYAGAIPYYSRWRHIDMLGLNNKYIADNKRPSMEYLSQVKPDLIIIPLDKDGNINYEDLKPFLEYAQENNYTLIKLPWDNFIYYLNPKIEHFDEIKQALNDLNYKK